MADSKDDVIVQQHKSISDGEENTSNRQLGTGDSPMYVVKSPDCDSNKEAAVSLQMTHENTDDHINYLVEELTLDMQETDCLTDNQLTPSPSNFTSGTNLQTQFENGCSKNAT